MKKLSLMIACVGIVSASVFGSGLHKTNPQDDSKKQKAESAKPVQKMDAAGKPIEVARPVQAISATPAKTDATVSDPSKVQTERAPSNVKDQATKKVSTPAKKAEDSSMDKK